MDVSIIIVDYNSLKDLKSCLQSIIAHTKRKFELFVISNSNYNEKLIKNLELEFPNVDFFFNKKNLGYAKAVNQGLRRGKGEYILILNPDTLLKSDVIAKMLNYMKENTKIGILGPKQIDMHGRVHTSCRTFITLSIMLLYRTPLNLFHFARKIIDRHFLKDFDFNKNREVDWICGAAMFARREALEDVGLMDERYFLYVEDMDWCRRFWQKGWKVVYFSEASIIHKAEYESTKNGFKGVFKKNTWYHLSSLMKYWLKYFAKDFYCSFLENKN